MIKATYYIHVNYITKILETSKPAGKKHHSEFDYIFILHNTVYIYTYIYMYVGWNTSRHQYRFHKPFQWSSSLSVQNSSQEEPRELCKMPLCCLLKEVEDCCLVFSSAFWLQYSVPYFQQSKKLGSPMENMDPALKTPEEESQRLRSRAGREHERR